MLKFLNQVIVFTLTGSVYISNNVLQYQYGWVYQSSCA